MLTHRIELHTKAQPTKDYHEPSERYTGTYGNEEHKRFIHQRAFTKCKLIEGEHVSWRGHTGIIIDILGSDAWDAIEWNGLECKFVHVYFYDINGECVEQVLHPSVLRRL
jgi:hypothetical protein